VAVSELDRLCDFDSDKLCRRCGRRPDDGAGLCDFLTVPQPPDLNLSRTSDIALVTVGVGHEAESMLAITEPYMREYAKRVCADFVKLDWPGHPIWPMSAKFGIASALDHYHCIVYVDADVLLRPGCVNLFAQCKPWEMGVVDELAFHRQMPRFKIEDEHQEFRRRMGLPVVNLPWYFNAGVMFVPKSHRELLLPPKIPILKGFCSEQNHTNYRLLSSGMPYKLMDRRCNWMWWTGLDDAPPDAVLHFAGLRTGRLKEMAKWAAKHPIPEGHGWAIDSRHRDWIRAELFTGRYRRVLEIGSHMGYSTAAFLDALKAGTVDEVHLCEPRPTPELLELIKGRPGVTLHRERSVNLLGNDCRWDLVFLDGDHSVRVVTKEAELLIAARVPAVFAHDTAAAGRYPRCEGPSLLKAAFTAASYRCTEDAEFRPGERTDRGMMLAIAGK
jgi:hypothetical protein